MTKQVTSKDLKVLKGLSEAQKAELVAELEAAGFLVTESCPLTLFNYAVIDVAEPLADHPRCSITNSHLAVGEMKRIPSEIPNEFTFRYSNLDTNFPKDYHAQLSQLYINFAEKHKIETV